MRAELLRILDRSYSTERFGAAAQSSDVVTPMQTLPILLRCVEDKIVAGKPLEIAKSEIEQISRLIELGELIKDERTSGSIELVVDIYLRNQFRMEYSGEWKEELCTLKEAVVWHYLSRCKIWPTICKQLNKSKDKEYKLRCLIQWYFEFTKRVGLSDTFEPDALSRKDLRTVTKKKLISSSNSEVIQAAMAKDYERLDNLFKQGIDIQSIEPPNERFQGVTRLRASHIACDNGDIKMCRLLDGYKPNWQAEDSEMMTPIFYAIKAGSLEVLKFLVEEKKVNMEKLEIQKRTPFYWACTQGEMEIIQYLRDKGADINRSSEIGRTALSKACFLGRKDIVEYLINCKEINLNCRDKKGRTPLHNAVFGPKGGREAHKFGTCESDSPQCAILLLERGVDANQTDNDLNSGLHIALSSEALGSIPVLVAYGCDLKHRNKFQETPIMVGCKFGHFAAVNILVQNFNDSVTTKDLTGSNCLVLVAKNLSDGKKVHPLFHYLLPTYLNQIMKHENALEDIEDTLNKVISHKANKEILAFQRFLRDNEVKVHIKLDVLKLSLESLEDDVVLQLLSSEPLTNHELEALIGCTVSLRKLALLEALTNRLGKQLSTLEFPLHLLEKCKHVNDKMLTAAMTLLNVDILKGRFESGQSILHFLTDNKKIGSLTQILKLFVGIYGGAVRNHFLLKYDHGELKNILKEQLADSNNDSGMTCGELALVRKYMDVYKILETYIVNYSDQHLGTIQHFKIEQYTVLKETDEVELERFKNHEQLELLNKLIEECNEMPAADLLERINSVSHNEEQLRSQISHLDNESIKPHYKTLRDSRKIFYCQTESQLEESLKQFIDITIVAIDLEYFVETTTNQNVICTLQLSCASRDMVIDCLRIQFGVVKKYIQPMFHNPAITKVLHGCEQDLIILKTNFNLSIVNSMDTAKVEMLLLDKIEMPGLKMLSVKYLHGLEMDKEYQTSEWRLRPLPKAMLEYARCDSLNLLLIYLNILKAIPITKVRDIVSSNLKTALKNNKQQAQLIKGICPNKGASDS